MELYGYGLLISNGRVGDLSGYVTWRVVGGSGSVVERFIVSMAETVYIIFAAANQYRA